MFSSLFILIELFDLRNHYRFDIRSAKMLITYLSLRIPFLAYFSIPVAVLVASVFTLALRANLSETTAILASGISAWKMISPLVYTTSIVAILLLIGTEWKIPEWSERADYIRRVEIRHKSPPAKDYLNLAFSSQDRYILSERFSPVDNIMDSVTIITPTENHNLLKRRQIIRELKYVNGLGWIDQDHPNQEAIALPAPKIIEMVATFSGFKPLTEKPAEAVKVSTLINEYLMLRSLRESADDPSKITSAMALRMVKINTKISFPLTLPFLSVLGATIGMALGRRRGILFALTGALFYTLGYLLILQTSVKFAEVAANTPSLQLYAGLVPWTSTLLVVGLSMKRLLKP